MVIYRSKVPQGVIKRCGCHALSVRSLACPFFPQGGSGKPPLNTSPKVSRKQAHSSKYRDTECENVMWYFPLQIYFHQSHQDVAHVFLMNHSFKCSSLFFFERNIPSSLFNTPTERSTWCFHRALLCTVMYKTPYKINRWDFPNSWIGGSGWVLLYS